MYATRDRNMERCKKCMRENQRSHLNVVVVYTISINNVTRCSMQPAKHIHQ